MIFVKTLLLGILLIFVAPVLATLAWWMAQDRPANWRSADWSSSAVLPAADSTPEAAIYIMGARTGGLKGAISIHSWIVTKKPGATTYDRYDKVGWGSPIRRNSRAADGFWYSNRPFVIREITGDAAAALIPQVEKAIASYPFAHAGDYQIWPGPNSNTFVAHVLCSAPGLGTLPPNATGRDFAPGFASLEWSNETRDLHATLHGLAGFAIGATSGVEIHFLGVVAGIDFASPALKIPAYGRVPLW